MELEFWLNTHLARILAHGDWIFGLWHIDLQRTIRILFKLSRMYRSRLQFTILKNNLCPINCTASDWVSVLDPFARRSYAPSLEILSPQHFAMWGFRGGAGDIIIRSELRRTVKAHCAYITVYGNQHVLHREPRLPPVYHGRIVRHGVFEPVYGSRTVVGSGALRAELERCWWVAG